MSKTHTQSAIKGQEITNVKQFKRVNQQHDVKTINNKQNTNMIYSNKRLSYTLLTWDRHIQNAK